MSNEVELTPEAYSRWLQAQRPPIQWFLELDADEQGMLAELGAFHRIDSILELAHAIHDPELFEAQIYATGDPETTNPEAEAVLVARQAAKIVAGLVGETPQEPVSEPVPVRRRSFAGVIQGREDDDGERVATKAKHARFLGAPLDAREAVE